jgi:hypothetical protein
MKLLSRWFRRAPIAPLWIEPVAHRRDKVDTLRNLGVPGVLLT